MSQLSILLLFVCASCINFKPAAMPRYFEPQLSLTDPVSTTRAVELRLRPVTGVNHLRERMVWRRPGGEVGFHDFLRWTDYPTSYLQRALERELFESQSFTRSSSTQASTADVVLIAFEEVCADSPFVEAAATLRVYSPAMTALCEQTIRTTRPLADDLPETKVAAYSDALQDLVLQMAGRLRTLHEGAATTRANH